MSPPVALEVLEFSHPSVDPNLVFSTEALIRALDCGLRNLRAVGFLEGFCTEQRVLEDEEVDEILLRRLVEKWDAMGESGEGKEDLLMGVYYI